MKKTPPPKKAKKGRKGKKGGKDNDRVRGGGKSKKKGDVKYKTHGDLPKHWEEHLDDDGATYYFNTKTDEVRIARAPSHGNVSPRMRGCPGLGRLQTHLFASIADHVGTSLRHVCLSTHLACTADELGETQGHEDDRHRVCRDQFPGPQWHELWHECES